MNETASTSDLWKQGVRDKLFQLSKQTWEEMQVAGTQQETRRMAKGRLQLKEQNKMTILFNSRQESNKRTEEGG